MSVELLGARCGRSLVAQGGLVLEQQNVKLDPLNKAGQHINGVLPPCNCAEPSLKDRMSRSLDAFLVVRPPVSRLLDRTATVRLAGPVLVEQRV